MSEVGTAHDKYALTAGHTYELVFKNSRMH